MNAIRALFLALLLCWGGTAAADVPVPPLTGRVVDQTGTLSPSDIASLTATLKDLEQRRGSQIAVLIVPTTQPETIEQFSIRAAEAWKIGRKRIDDGALIVVAKNDHKLRIEVGYGLEGSLTDVTARRIIDEVITPRFRAGDFAGGISDGVARIIAVIDGEPLPPPSSSAVTGEDNLDWIGYFLNPFMILIYLAIGSVLRQILGRFAGGVAAGGVVGIFVWLVMGSVIAAVISGVALSLFTAFADTLWNQGAINRPRGGRGGGWVVGPFPGGGGGWSRGGWGGGGGGFSGGGGGFGGGGASGSW